VAKAVVFLSHANEEAGVARVLKDAIEAAFLNIAEVFVSTDPRSLRAGNPWLETIKSRLAEARAMIVLASPTSVRRPWVNWEAGAMWMRDKAIIPMCHSGMTRATLPLPLASMQSLDLLDESHLDELFSVLAGELDCDKPKVDYGELLEKLRAALDRIPGPVQPDLPRRLLSEEREELEGDVHRLILRMQSLRASGAVPQSEERLDRLVAAAQRFRDDPASFMPDAPLLALQHDLEQMVQELLGLATDANKASLANANKRVQLGTATQIFVGDSSSESKSERVAPDEQTVQQAILKALRVMAREQARTPVILHLDLDEVAESLGTVRSVVQDGLVDLLGLGMAEGYAETFGEPKEEGHCRITPRGMKAIRD
jgi:hypothetical protein